MNKPTVSFIFPSCRIQIVYKDEGFESRKIPGTKVKCIWGNEETGEFCINEADAEINICSGFRVVRHICQGCLPEFLLDQGCASELVEKL